MAHYLRHSTRLSFRPVFWTSILGILGVAANLGIASSAAASDAAAVQWKKSTYTVNGSTIVIFSKPITGFSPDSGILRIATSGGNLWFSEESLPTSPIVRMTPTGLATAYPLPTAKAGVEAVTSGPDGNIWFTEWHTSRIGKITPLGKITEYKTPFDPLQSVDIKAGADGNLWFATDHHGIGRATINGKIRFFPINNNATQPTALTPGPNKTIWFNEWAGNNVGFITATGQVTEYPAGLAGNGFGIAYGKDGRIWFADPQKHRIGAIRTNGTGLTYYNLRSTSTPDSIIAGPDGNLYFGEYGGAFAGRIGKITTAGKITEYNLPAAQGAFPVLGLTVQGGNIWFANNEHAKVGMLKLVQ
jgi:virginiamycin B lyase